MPTVSYGITNTADDAVTIPGAANSDTVTAFGDIAALIGPSTPIYGGLLFRGVAVSASDTPTAATVTIQLNPAAPLSGGAASSFGTNAGALHGVTTANPSSLPTDLSTLPRTTSSTTISVASTMVIDVLAQVIEMQAGRASGDAMAFVGNGAAAGTNGFVDVYDYSSSSTLCAQLSITYTAGGPPTLNALTLSPATTTDAAAIGDAVGALGGTTSGSTLSLTDDASGRFSLDGSTIKVASALTVGTYSITVRETLDGATNTPRDTTLSITVTEAPPLSFIASATGTTSATMPAHQAGDLILCWAYRDGSNTLPTLPGGQNWTELNAVTGANTNSARLVGKVATSSSEAVGTFTSATSVVVQVYRPRSGYTATWGAVAANTGASTTVNYPALMLQAGDGSSWVAAFSGHRSTNTSLETPPAGMTLRSTVVDATDEATGFDTNGGVASWPSTNVSVGGTSSGWRSAVVEIVVAVASTRRLPRHSFWL